MVGRQWTKGWLTQTTQRVTQKSQKLESSWTSGSRSTTQSQVKEESLIVNLQKNKLDVTVDETMTGISAQVCSEIILRSKQFCNLSEVVIRATDDMKALKEKVKFATILGTFQSTLVNFKYLTRDWAKNTEEERLLGVNGLTKLSGITCVKRISDNTLTNGKYERCCPCEDLDKRLDELRKVAIATNAEWADKIGINQSVSITCVKPSGTVSQLVDSASGIHARHNPYYIRTVRADKKDPLAMYMRDAGFPCEDDVMKPDHTYVFSFPMKAPENAVMRQDMTAIEQLELWLVYQKHWCEHKPSVTISVKEDEWFEVGAWVYKHFDWMSGVSFLPYSEHV